MKVVAASFLIFAGITLIAFCSGYFDPDLSDMRRCFGCTLIVLAILIGLPAVVRLVDDWPRMKPQYNIDFAFIQIGICVVILATAFLLGGRFGAFVSPLVEHPPSRPPPSGDSALPQKNR